MLKERLTSKMNQIHVQLEELRAELLQGLNGAGIMQIGVGRAQALADGIEGVNDALRTLKGLIDAL